MQIYKYCHCLLFAQGNGLSITEYLPEIHEGRGVYDIVADPIPSKGQALKHKAQQSSGMALDKPSKQWKYLTLEDIGKSLVAKSFIDDLHVIE
jgi:ferredoxin-thioredoxin reductase catalytic chain